MVQHLQTCTLNLVPVLVDDSFRRSDSYGYEMSALARGVGKEGALCQIP